MSSENMEQNNPFAGGEDAFAAPTPPSMGDDDDAVAEREGLIPTLSPTRSETSPANTSSPQSLRRQQFQYRRAGGWTTSLCRGLFRGGKNDPRSSCCAVTCCGVLLMDRNVHLLHQLHNDHDENLSPLPPAQVNWKKRCAGTFAVPFVFLLVMSIMNSLFGTEAEESPGFGKDVRVTVTTILQVAFLVWMIIALYRARAYRLEVRKYMLEKMKRDREANNNVEANEEFALEESKMQTSNATGACCCFYRDDSDEVQAVEQDEEKDLASCLWNALANFCCGACCGCWLVLCGMCATGQEDRQIRDMIKHQKGEQEYQRMMQVDYITFQPWMEYYSKILTTRTAALDDGGSEFRQLFAWDNLSELSKLILKWFAGGVLALFVYSWAFGSVLSFVVCVVGTTIQGIAVLYIVHWMEWPSKLSAAASVTTYKSTRLDISADAIIKYTAAGFLLATFMAMVVEWMMMAFINPVALLVFIVQAVIMMSEEDVPPDQWIQDPSNLQKLLKDNIWLVAIFIFIFAFFVAGMVEELVKYFIYWSTETPDVLRVQDLADHTTATTNVAVNDSKTRQARATTIAMIAVATGFAWSENLMYVRSQATVWNQFCLLVIRSIFPVHQLCAAIQSIGVVRRDVEMDPKWKLGRITFYAILLHGLFDFILFFWAIMWNFFINKKSADDDNGNDNPNALPKEINIVEVLQSLSLCLPVVLIGVVYYFVQARKQRQRLAMLDGVDPRPSDSDSSSSSLPPPQQPYQPPVEGAGDSLSAPLLST